MFPPQRNPQEAILDSYWSAISVIQLPSHRPRHLPNVHMIPPSPHTRYECKETDGNFMVAFHDCCAAVEWDVTLQLALMAEPWPLELLQIDVSSEVFDPENSMQVPSLCTRPLHTPYAHALTLHLPSLCTCPHLERRGSYKSRGQIHPAGHMHRMRQFTTSQ